MHTHAALQEQMQLLRAVCRVFMKKPLTQIRDVQMQV